MRLFAHRYHRNDDPWEDAPPWALELREITLQIFIATSQKENLIVSQQKDIADALAKVQDDVRQATSVSQALGTYVKGLRDQIAQIASASTDTETAAALTALSTQLEANTAADAAAMVENTPQAPAAPPADGAAPAAQ